METNIYFSVSFLTDQNEVETISIPRANTALTDVTVRSLMQSIIDLGIVFSPKGYSEEIESAEIITTSREVVA